MIAVLFGIFMSETCPYRCNMSELDIILRQLEDQIKEAKNIPDKELRDNTINQILYSIQLIFGDNVKCTVRDKYGLTHLNN